MNLLFIDIETYSSADISKTGAYKYIDSPDFEILLISYAFDDGPVLSIDLTREKKIPDFFVNALNNPNIIKVAHNAVFERTAFKAYGYNRPPEEWYCTMVKAAYCGLPLSLDDISKVLDLSNKKLGSGRMLINYFSKPCKPTMANGGRTRNYPYHNPDKWNMYIEYNEYDVKATQEIYYMLEKYKIPDLERRLYAVDQYINDRGILIDYDIAVNAIKIDTLYTAEIKENVKTITGLDNPNSGPQIKKWLFDKTGIVVDTLSKDTVDDVIRQVHNYPEAVEVLNMRKKLSKTSIKKYYAMINCAMPDNRVRGTFQLYGANRTGRWAGRLLQLQNLSKNHVANIELPRELVRKADIESIELLYDDVSDMLSQLVRTAIIAPEGKILAVADFSAIEARVISWLACEKWRMDVFSGDGKIYEATGSKMFNVPISAITKGSELRQKSKISELALGYGGAVGALRRMGGERMGLSDGEMRILVDKWRKANPCIVRLWHELEEKAKNAVLYKKTICCTPRNLIFTCDTDNLIITLPSGRQLFYRHPQLKKNGLFYEGVIQETKQWGSVDTYGGKLTENVIQAVARDLLANSLINLHEAGYDVVAHIHDEVIVEVPIANADKYYNDIVRIISISPSWANGLVLRADGYITPFYRKD